VKKTLRICLLLLLVAMLPLRGALAAAMMCPPTGTGTTHHASPGPVHPHDHHAMTAAASHDHAGHAHPTTEHGDHGSSGAQSCNLCCDFCSVTPIIASLPTVPAPSDLGTIQFPDPCAPAPSFLSDGQERPPRSS